MAPLRHLIMILGQDENLETAKIVIKTKLKLPLCFLKACKFKKIIKLA